MDLEQELAELRERVTALERAQWSGPPRLGPRAESPDEAAERSKKIADILVKTTAGHEHETDRDGRQICTTKGDAPSEARAKQTNETGQHESYIVLCEEERRKGFVRPYRDRYMHVGGFVTVDDTFDGDGKMQERREGGCRGVTTMGHALSETYARDPKFYGATFCVNCNRHLPVAEFVWTADGLPVGS